MSQEYVLCDRLHRVTSKEQMDCKCGGHTYWSCRMRVGSRACGWTWLYPAKARECMEDEE